MNICDCVKWSVIQIKDCSWDAVQAMLPLVSEQRREQALQYKHAFGQYACLKSYLMLQDLLREHYGIEGDLVFSYNEHGKPMLKEVLAKGNESGAQEVSNIHFSISHCKEAIAHGLSVGILIIDDTEAVLLHDFLDTACAACILAGVLHKP